MAGIRIKSQQIRNFILANLESNSANIVNLVIDEFAITRQAVNKHMRRLIDENLVSVEGATKNRHYCLKPTLEWKQDFPLDGSVSESLVWHDYVSPLLKGLPDNIKDIWHYGVTEIFNNVIDHSNGEYATVQVKQTAVTTEVHIYDNGEGIFKKIQREFKLHDERHSVLELAKGKLTTDPKNHSGEGIFFSSRAFCEFIILSGGVYFSHNHDEREDWILERQSAASRGTMVIMKMANNAERTMKEVFDSFTTGEDYGFTKTVVPVKLAQYGDDKLVSRSQAKRLLSRIEKFKLVVFDFNEVESVGQAFADEVFRVFANQHPNIELVPLHANLEISQMISRATAR